MKRRIRQKGTVSKLQALEAAKGLILREAEYVLAVLNEDRSFWDYDGGYLVCIRCGEQLTAQKNETVTVGPQFHHLMNPVCDHRT